MPAHSINRREWRPITFQGRSLPSSLMGITMLEPVLDLDEEELGAWLWKLTICKGVTKGAPAVDCARHARKTVDLMLEHRQRVLDGIGERLAEHGFDPETTFREWIAALMAVAELADAAGENDCSWSAPSHPEDDPQAWTQIDRFLRDAQSRLQKEANGDSRNSA